MRIAFRTLVFSLGLLLPACAQQPAVQGGQVETRAARTLHAELAHAGKDAPEWVGYSIPVVAGFSSGYGEDETVYLEGDHYNGNGGAERQREFDHANLLLRVDKGAVTKIRLETPARKLDSGGLKFVWLTGVSQDESIQEFTALANDAAQERKIRDSAVMVIAQHQSPLAVTKLTEMAKHGDVFVREKSAFWLAAHRGQEGAMALLQLTRTEQDEQLRAKLAFDLTLPKNNPAMIDELIWLARNDSSTHVRKQAQFWMAQKAGKQVAGQLRQIVENDPDHGLRKSAVFALSQLPQGEATAQLIQVAETNKDPEIRKQTVFWLGQSKDPKALDYLAKLLR